MKALMSFRPLLFQNVSNMSKMEKLEREWLRVRNVLCQKMAYLQTNPNADSQLRIFHVVALPL